MNRFAPRAQPIRTVVAVVALTCLVAGCGDSGSKASDKKTTTTKADASSPTSEGSTATTSPAGGTTQPASSGPSSSSPSRSSTFCSKISDSEASAVLGVPISRRESASATATSCIKGTQRQTDLTKGAFVSFSTFPAAGPMASFGQVKTSFPDAKVLSGIGDQALFSSSGGLVIGFLKGKVFSVQVVKAGRPSTEADAVAMAKAMLGRLD